MRNILHTHLVYFFSFSLNVHVCAGELMRCCIKYNCSGRERAVVDNSCEFSFYVRY